jgi:hypothetical protein
MGMSTPGSRWELRVSETVFLSRLLSILFFSSDLTVISIAV